MKALDRLAVWLDIRPDETRKLSLLVLGAFFIIAFSILGRSLREGLYLGTFPIETLPYITIAVAVMSVPAVAVFGRLLSRQSPKSVLIAVGLVIGGGLFLLWPVATRFNAAIVGFYLWTTLGTVLLTSGFWVAISEHFPIRSAKRLFGLIGAGGTAGAMVMGNSLVWLTRQVPLGWLILLLIGLLALFLITQVMLPASADHLDDRKEQTSSLAESFALTWRSPHLRTIALIVAATNIAATLLDFQFKDWAQAQFTTGEQLISFFGAFYGWTGGIALFIQLVVVARFMRYRGIAASLAVLPAILLLGSVGLLILPSLLMVTLVRGGDASLRKSLYRSAVEVLYVPVSSVLRRKTKTFIDSVVDAAGEGTAAGIIFLWVTWADFSPRYLSVYVIVLAGFLLFESRRMGRQYFRTVTEKLEEGGEEAAKLSGAVDLGARDLMSGTFTRLDIPSLMRESGLEEEETEPAVPTPTAPAEPKDTLAMLRSTDIGTIAQVLTQMTEWDEEHVPALTRLLARDQIYDLVTAVLASVGDSTVPYLVSQLKDDSTEFVIRRRIPRVLSKIGGPLADDALLDTLSTNRFEIRYRAAIALVRRRARGLPTAEKDVDQRVWAAIRSEVSKDRPVWELQRLLDSFDSADDELVSEKTGVRGSLSLEHTFRLLTLVLPPDPIQAAFHGMLVEDEQLRSFALEYLEQVLPADLRDRLWPFIGDVSEYQREKRIRPLNEVVSDLMTTGATLFADEDERAALKRLLEEQEQ